MVDGIQLDYQLKKGMSSIFNQTMFGRISCRKKNAHTYAYYIPGVLADIKYYRIFEGRVLIATSQKVDFDPVMKYCEKFEINTVAKPEEDVFMRTGKERWLFHANEKGLEIDRK